MRLEISSRFVLAQWLRKGGFMLKENDMLLGKYRILSAIAQGGMGAVWLAEDTTLKKKWAVKEIFKDSKEFLASVNPDGTLTEIEILTMLDNPYAPRIVDRYDDEEVLAVVMDFVDGKNLLQLLREKGPQREEKVIEWALCVCDLLSFLHTHKPYIIYNDVKPENIILKADGSIKVIDFGIAKIPEKYPNEIPIGTPGYASPEHYLGKTDARSDIYSLALTMYHLLTGDNPATKNFRRQPLKTFCPYISKKLEKIIETAANRLPEKRYQTASDFRDALMDYQIEQFASENTKTTLLMDKAEHVDTNEEEPQSAQENAVMQASEKQTPPTQLKKSPAASLFSVLFSGIGSVVRFVAFIIIGVFAAIGITTLLEPALREVFFELLRDAWNIISVKV